MKNLLAILFLFAVGGLAAQVTFVIDALPEYTPPDDYIYIAGDFNGWTPGDPNFRLAKNEQQKWAITLAAATQGTRIQFKFTRGSWETVEKGQSGEEIGNRLFTYGNGSTVNIVIYNWAQGGGGGSTAAENVIIMDDAFEMPQLGRTRRIWLYLPPGYETSENNYPVLYMHDGQNLFDDATSFAGEWHIDETLNDLFDQGINVPIVVGIDNGGAERLNEYTPWKHVVHGGGDGELYMQFITETLKPYIDGHYRTLPGREHTGIMGSSLGGLISHFGALDNQDIFSKAGIFSPSYWFSDSLWAFTREAGKQDAMRLYLMCGGMEGQNTINDVMDMQDSLLVSGYQEEDLSVKIIPGGQHNENLWSGDFGEAYLWLFAAYANDITEHVRYEVIRLYPNPATGMVSFPADFPRDIDSVDIIDMQGVLVNRIEPVTGREIDISGLSNGIYVILVRTGNTWYQGKVVKE